MGFSYAITYPVSIDSRGGAEEDIPEVPDKYLQYATYGGMDQTLMSYYMEDMILHLQAFFGDDRGADSQTASCAFFVNNFPTYNQVKEKIRQDGGTITRYQWTTNDHKQLLVAMKWFAKNRFRLAW
jgi:hypothetical protein